MIADAINLPLVVAMGLAVFVPLTIVITLIESVAFRLLLAIPVRTVFRRVLWANIASAMAGVFVLMFQDGIVLATGGASSIPGFVANYWWIALVLIAAYFIESVVVESLVLLRKRFTHRIERSQWAVGKTLLLGNLASYCLTGPLFYLATRPRFGGIETLPTTNWTANADLPTTTSAPATTSSDASGWTVRVSVWWSPLRRPRSCCPKRATHSSIAAWMDIFISTAREQPTPSKCGKTNERFLMQAVSLSPDQTRIAYTLRQSAQDVPREKHGLRIYDIESGQTTNVPTFGLERVFLITYTVAWARDGSRVYVGADGTSVVSISSTPPWEYSALDEAVVPENLVNNYVRWGGGRYGSTDDWGPIFREDSAGEIAVACWPGLGAHLRVTRGDDVILTVQNDYGFLKLGLPGPDAPTILPRGAEVLCEWWGQLYVLDYERRRLGPLAHGKHYLAPLPRFRVHFD